MNENNFLSIPKSQHYEKIYRIMPLWRLFELFDDKVNVLVKPSKWSDPFENFIAKSQKVFGQCWSRHYASDAMWNIYSSYPKYPKCSEYPRCSKYPKCSDCSKSLKDLIPVRIRSTVHKVAKSLIRDSGADYEAFIGRVEYLTKEKLNEHFQKNKAYNPIKMSPKQLAETLLLKRNAFKHEREIRLIVVTNDDKKDDKFSYSIEPCSFVDEILVDPFLKKRQGLHLDWKTLKREIESKTSLSNGKIKKSLLDKLPARYA